MRGLVFSIDDAYTMPFKVLWHSLIKTESIPAGTPIFILHEDMLTPPSIEDLIAFFGRGDLEVSFVDVGSQLPDDLPISKTDHVSKAAFYRLYVGSILPQEITSVVYLDSDAVVIRSVKELFEIKLTHPVAAVDHLALEEQLRVWGGLSGNYFQSGVLIIDLERWRADDYGSIFAQILNDDRDRIRWWDQCVLNIAFEDNWQRLPVWFNFCWYARQAIDLEDNRQSVRFLHLDGADKPWKYFSKDLAAMYWYGAYREAFGSEFDFKSIMIPFRRRIISRIRRALRRILKS